SSFVENDWTLSLSYAGSYLNLDDILATSERTSCRLRVYLPGLAPLLLSDTGVSNTGTQSTTCDDDEEPEDILDTVSSDIPAGTRLELPIWLAVALGSGRRQVLTVDLPFIYREAFSEVFDADPSVVDLRRKAPLFYLLLFSLMNFGPSKAGQAAATAARVFQARLRSVMDAALNASRHDTVSSTSRFDNLEMALFRIGQTDRQRLERWTARYHCKIEPNAFMRSICRNTQNKRPHLLAQSENQA
ncbi:DNA replication complex GINS protein PSF3, partial [Fasciolopsis buskii]